MSGDEGLAASVSVQESLMMLSGEWRRTTREECAPYMMQNIVSGYGASVFGFLGFAVFDVTSRVPGVEVNCVLWRAAPGIVNVYLMFDRGSPRECALALDMVRNGTEERRPVAVEVTVDAWWTLGGGA